MTTSIGRIPKITNYGPRNGVHGTRNPQSLRTNNYFSQAAKPIDVPKKGKLKQDCRNPYTTSVDSSVDSETFPFITKEGVWILINPNKAKNTNKTKENGPAVSTTQNDESDPNVEGIFDLEL